MMFSSGPRPSFNKKKVQGEDPTSVHLSFVNRRSEHIDLYWLNHDKVLQKFHTFPPAGTFNINSHLGHVWVAKVQGSDGEVGKWVTSRKLKTVEIR